MVRACKNRESASGGEMRGVNSCCFRAPNLVSMVIYGVSNIYTLLFSTRSLGVCVQTDFQSHCMHLIPG